MAIKPMSTPARVGDKMINGWPETCSRKQHLEDRDAQRTVHNEYAECRRICKRPGYETLTKMKFGK